MAVTVTNTKILKPNTGYAVTVNAATSTTIDEAEVFTITPTKGDGQVVITINNAATDQGSITYSIAAGALWAGSAAKTGTIEQGTKDAIMVEFGKYLSSTGTIPITLTPASGKRLLTDHTASVEVLETPF